MLLGRVPRLCPSAAPRLSLGWALSSAPALPQAREQRENEEMDARIDGLQASVDRLEEQGRSNFENLSGRLDKLQGVKLSDI